MSGKHTPGPWIKDGLEQLRSENGKQVETYACGISWGAWSPEREANARLIAAAPELLDALKALVDYPDDMIPTRIWEDARAAIAKVTGDE